MDALPQLSVAVQVLVMMWLPAQLPAAFTSLLLRNDTRLDSTGVVALPAVDGIWNALQAIVQLSGRLDGGPGVSVIG